MIETLKTAFKNTEEKYCKILNSYYPAHNSTGFTERNLTNNFANSLELALTGSPFTWFEAPLSATDKKHLDAIVFHPQSKTSFLIEAKRLSNTVQKINEIKKDIERMKSNDHHSTLERGLRGVSVENRYAIVLADVWLESDSKVDAYNSWPECVCADAIWANSCGFESLNTTESWKNNYKLLIAAIKI